MGAQSAAQLTITDRDNHGSARARFNRVGVPSFDGFDADSIHERKHRWAEAHGERCGWRIPKLADFVRFLSDPIFPYQEYDRDQL